MSEKIGLGIITFQPRATFKKCLEFDHSKVDEIIIINDGEVFSDKPMDGLWNEGDTKIHILQHTKNMGVGVSKNDALRKLHSYGCDHIFLMEDDIYIKDSDVFDKYIQASKKSGIQHFNFSQHGIMNKKFSSPYVFEPNPKLVIDYSNDVSISLFQHCVGAFSYYTRKCIDDVGYIDEYYYNACEHVDHTKSIIDFGYHPPFWWFSDITGSHKYLGDEEWSFSQSTISCRPDRVKLSRDADAIFLKKHGHLPLQTPMTSEDNVIGKITDIKNKYGLNNLNM